MIIKRSELKSAGLKTDKDLNDAIEKYCLELQVYAKHTDMVLEGKAQHHPPPQAAPVVDRCIFRDRDSSGRMLFTKVLFEIIEDSPLEEAPEMQEFRAMKEFLMQSVIQTEQNKMASIMPAGKWREANFRYQDILEADDERRKGMRPEAYENRNLLDDAVVAGRDKEDHEFAVGHKARIDYVKKIQRHGAKLLSQIEDLTMENIKNWKPEPFPEIQQ